MVEPDLVRIVLSLQIQSYWWGDPPEPGDRRPTHRHRTLCCPFGPHPLPCERAGTLGVLPGCRI